MQGLLELLQGGGQTICGGWAIIIELITAVSLSMSPTGNDPVASPIVMSPYDKGVIAGNSSSNSRPVSVSFENSSESGYMTPTKDNRSFDNDFAVVPWPEASLLTAFSCMKLIVDDFLELLDKDVMKELVTCVSLFSSQISDVNISLTSVEMLWKVTDYIMTTSRQRGDEETTSAVLELMMTRLMLLTLDSRPEVGYCVHPCIP
jgi:hypothetical protein